MKPDNVMIADRGRAYLLDWSVARLVCPRAGSIGPTSEAPVGTVGTPGYLAPEQARGNPTEIGERSDVFGLGALLYQVLTGTAPYGERDDAELLRQARLGRVVAVEDAARGLPIPASLVGIARRATEPSPGDRYETVRELRSDLLAVEKDWARGEALRCRAGR